ncbi:twin-arginine translocase subunit TatC [Aestuariimicrobium kwangyangense]|uniref:twin-arginine translocase subunit TatC n=1 Tax=Aestuariimicrobium kwangyangense TaxID=396389 RepID=UPI0003B3079D|nr:twin-arginine translocase subunit TatC [Aestuariimicrobium kwangyangense]
MTTTTEPRKHKLNLGWLTPPPKTDDGTMALVDHLKEFRYRVIISAIGLVLMMALSMVFYKYLFAFMLQPAFEAEHLYKAAHPENAANVSFTVNGITGGFMLMLKIGGVAGVILSCPIWLYQLWSFIVPGLLAQEKKYAVRFLGSAIPLFLAGVALGYWISPKGFAVLMSFNPAGVQNLNELSEFLGFLMRMLLVFGLSFLLPVVIVALNMLGVLKAAQLNRYRNLSIFGCFVFGAVATPSVDPFSMLALSFPMVAMFFISLAICSVNDRRRAEQSANDDVVLDESKINVD